MTKTGDKMIRAANEALAFVRGDCDHEWRLRAKDSGLGGVTSECAKCGVRVTTYDETPHKTA